MFVGYERCYYSTGLDFEIYLRARKVSVPFERQAPRPVRALQGGLGRGVPPSPLNSEPVSQEYIARREPSYPVQDANSERLNTRKP